MKCALLMGLCAREEPSKHHSTSPLNRSISQERRCWISVRELGLRGLFSIVVFIFTPHRILKCHDVHVLLGSSQGRGPRCAGWFQDYIYDIARFGRKSVLEIRVLKGGIKGWVKEFEGSMMEGFDEKYWEQFK